ncbi:MAG TPA: hypothetical protein PKE63_06605, partial [Lacibacter sp.]|nr:hypothetical protein [Lacibacter sp.]
GQGGDGWSSITPTSGNTVVPAPVADWVKVTYTIIPTNACVRIEMFDLNGSLAGNDFAIDDIELLPPPQPLSLSYSVTGLSCFGANDGAIVAYGAGGVKPYAAYSITGPVNATNTTGVFASLPPGTYNISVTDGATPTPATVSVFSIIVTSPPTITVTPSNPTICTGTPVTITASGAGPYSWTAIPADPTLTTPNAAAITVSPTQNTTYTVTSVSSSTQNLIFNGDFSSGNVGFATDYDFFAPSNPNPSGSQRSYGIVTNPQAWFAAFAACTGRGGAGNMMVIDGSTFSGGNDRVWCQTVPVKPGRTYNFGYWIQTLVANNPANIEVLINGVSLGAALLAPATTCNWVERTYVWNSGAATTATICIFDRNTASAGNDFALDDITFTTTNTCVLSAQSVVTVTGSAAITEFSYPTPVCAGSANVTPTLASGFTTGGTFTATPAGLVINATTGLINVAASTPGAYTITYTVPASGCALGGTFNFSFTIASSITPVTGFGYPTLLCTNGTNPSPNLASGFTSGGTFNGPAGVVINPTTGVINLGASTPGTYTITYSLAASGCSPAASGTASVTITPVVTPTTGFSYASPVCAGSANLTPATVSGFTTGGAFSSTAGLSINAGTGVINVAASTPGTYTVTYAVAASGCNPAGSGTASVNITPVVTPTTGFSYASPVCAGSANLTPATVSGFTAGGVYSSTA